MNGNGTDGAEDEDDHKSALLELLSKKLGVELPMIASCSICDMKFSTRANARRHERNMHGIILNPMNLISHFNESPQQNLSAAMQPGMHFLLQSSTSPNMVTSTPEAKPKMKLKFKPPPEVYDYTNPQKYRHLLTPNKLAFILRNLEFLAQVQDMTCKCCRKQYPSYKVSFLLVFCLIWLRKI